VTRRGGRARAARRTTAGRRQVAPAHVWRLDPATPGVPPPVTREEIFVVGGGSATASLDGSPQPLAAGSTLVLPAGVELSLATEDEALEAIVCLPVGGQGVIGDGEPFAPPWAA
jgi:mannose-6-phosphate isomerase-like protein (cupin superfamily)